jgi:hypothetical protein
MKTTSPTGRHLGLFAGTVLLVTLLSSVANPAFANALVRPADVAPPAGVSISITDGVSEVDSGSEVQYRATITNVGPAPVSGTLIVTIPAYSKYVDPITAHVSGDGASWNVTVDPGKSVSKNVKVTVGTIPKGEVRVTTLAALTASDDPARIVVRSADPDLIKGVQDPAHTVGRPAAGASDALTGIGVVGGVMAAVIVILAIVAFVWIRRRRQLPRRRPRVRRSGI